MLKKKKSLILLSVLGLLLIPTVAFAVSQTFTSTLLISPGSTVNGAVRNYSYINNKINLSIDAVVDNSAPKKIVVMIANKGLFGYSNIVRVIKPMTLYTCLNIDMGQVGNGNLAYRFGAESNSGSGNVGIGTYYSGLNSNTVKMTSYQ